jgi:hypothetical protein
LHCTIIYIIFVPIKEINNLKISDMKTTFINQNSENTIIDDGIRHLNARIEDFKNYMSFGLDNDNINDKKACLFWENNISFYDYGLSFDYVELGTFNNQNEDYFRFQLSWGGPSEEIRFYNDGTIIFVYLDWYSGVGFDVTSEDWAEFLKYFFEECGYIDFEEERNKYDYYTLLDNYTNN